MPSFTTIFRAVVMLGVAVIGVRAWQAYGPSTEQLKSVALRATEIAQSALSEPKQSPASAAEFDPRTAAPPFADVPSMMPPDPSDAGDMHANIANAAVNESIVDAPPLTPQGATPAETPAIPGDADQMPALLSRLEQLGGVDPQLVPWGASGQLHRFSCRAALDDNPKLNRHFEAVAAEPLSAIRQVVDEVETWRTAQSTQAELR